VREAVMDGTAVRGLGCLNLHLVNKSALLTYVSRETCNGLDPTWLRRYARGMIEVRLCKGL